MSNVLETLFLNLTGAVILDNKSNLATGDSLKDR